MPIRILPFRFALAIGTLLVAAGQPATSDELKFELRIAQSITSPEQPAMVVKEKESPTAAGPWNGKTAAIALTYDDGLNVHLDTVAPLLNTNNIQATFFLTGTADAVVNRQEDWTKLANQGHELGNHTMIHPCSGSLPGRDWVPFSKDLDRYTVDDYLDEISTASALINSIDTKTRRTFAYPCGDKHVNGVSIEDDLKGRFAAARGVSRGINLRGQINLYDLTTYSVSGHSFEEMQSEVQSALEKQGLLVFLFHGVGGEHGLNVERDQHKQLIEYLSGNRDRLWIAPLADVAGFVEKNGL